MKIVYRVYDLLVGPHQDDPGFYVNHERNPKYYFNEINAEKDLKNRLEKNSDSYIEEIEIEDDPTVELFNN